MKRIKKIFKSISKTFKKIINWFKVKQENKNLKKQIEILEEKIIDLESQIIKLEDLTDKDLNVQRIKDLRNTVDHERQIKRSLRLEIKDLREELKKIKAN